MKTLSIVAITAFAFLALANFASAQVLVLDVRSTTFPPNSTLPIRVIDDIPVDISPGVLGNDCAPNLANGAKNRSPALSWTNVPPFTSRFVVIAFDTTAQVFHWGMYNIPLQTRSLPENAGVAASTFGQQTRNYSGALGYKGPCPPANDPPHDYEFTVYSLNRPLTDADLPINSDNAALQRAMTGLRIIVGKGSITGRWSSAPCGGADQPECLPITP